ncbi:MAG TPA: hypothetical protein PLM07_13170 [Candidatus Rifleibacterium sp.]|nr:hypothetical protein [Candidatus Rifleibacterium sp.]HPT46836.1 hypothetical protein [Candidatus Rifleibacterium sp.]
MFIRVFCSLVLAAYLFVIASFIAFRMKAFMVLAVVWGLPALALLLIGVIKTSKNRYDYLAVVLTLILCLVQAFFAFLNEALNTPPGAAGMLDQGPFDLLYMFIAAMSAALIYLKFFWVPPEKTVG